MLELTHVDFRGPAAPDPALLAALPDDLRTLLEQVNGFIQFGGGLHVRGVCDEPVWHTLSIVWVGDHAFHRRYAAVRKADVPFAQDCMGDQFLLRDGKVVRLYAETGELSELGVGLFEFLAKAQADPEKFLNLQPLVQFHSEGGRLEPGQLLSVYPPFCCTESGNGPVSLRAVAVLDRLGFLADFARQIASVPDGDRIEFRIRKADGRWCAKSVGRPSGPSSVRRQVPGRPGRFTGPESERSSPGKARRTDHKRPCGGRGV